MAVQRIGIVLINLPKVNKTALEYLVLQMNSLQSTFEFEFLPTNPNEKFFELLEGEGTVSRELLRDMSSEFVDRFRDYLERLVALYKLHELPPDQFIILTLVKFSDNYYSMREGKLSVLDLGNWEQVLAPPSIYEFCTTLILRSAIAIVSPSLGGSIHLGTKGCLCDFTAKLDEARYKTLNAFICQYCRTSLSEDGFENLADEITNILKKDWLGKPDVPNTPANIVKKLGYNLFTTKGLEPTKRQKFLEFIQEEGIKQLINMLGMLIIAALLLWLGLK